MDSSGNKESWQVVCDAAQVKPFIGVRALVENTQIALFRIGERLYAIDAFDPFSRAAVLSRGLVGDLQEQIVVASPVYKQHFNLETGVCLEDETVRIAAYPVREVNGTIEINYHGESQQAADTLAMTG